MKNRMIFTFGRAFDELIEFWQLKMIISFALLSVMQLVNIVAAFLGATGPLFAIDPALVGGLAILFLVDLFTGIWSSLREHRFAWGKGTRQTLRKFTLYSVTAVSAVVVTNMFWNKPGISLVTNHIANFVFLWMGISDFLSILENTQQTEKFSKFIKAVLPIMKSVAPEAGEVARTLTEDKDEAAS